jgi:alkaline phosphatase
MILNNAITIKIYLLINYCIFTGYCIEKPPPDWRQDQFPDKWNSQAKQMIENILKKKVNNNIAKNIIVYLGDGMGLSTVTAGRIRKGQKQSYSLLIYFEKKE